VLKLSPRRVSYLSQKFTLLPARLPVPRQHDALTVLQTKAADIQRVGRSVLAQTPLLAVVDIAAGKAAQVIHLHHRLAKYPLRSGL